MSGQCVPATDSNCIFFDQKTKNCERCENGFMIDPTDRRRCINCAQIDPFCQRCYGLKQKNLETMKPKIACSSCFRWFYLSGSAFDGSEKSSCKKCPHGCLNCGPEECLMCQRGYYLLNGICKPLDIPNCAEASNEKGCGACYDGYFMDEKTNSCRKCSDSCATCRGPNDDDCEFCPITKVRWTPPRKVPEDDSIIYDFMLPTSSCLNDCSEKTGPQGSPLKLNPFYKACREETKSQPIIQKHYYFKRNQIPPLTEEKLLQDSNNFVFHLRDFVHHLREESEKELKQNQAENKPHSQVSPTCNFHGKALSHFNEERELSISCICLKGWTGPACEFNQELSENIVLFMNRFLDDLSHMQLTLDISYFYSIFSNLLEGTLSFDLLSRLFNIFKDEHDKYFTGDLSAFLTTFDKLLQKLYSQAEEFKYSEKYSQLIDNSPMASILEDRVHLATNLADYVLSQSLNHTTKIKYTQTQAFQVSYHSRLNSEYNGDESNMREVGLPGMKQGGLGSGALNYMIKDSGLEKLGNRVETVAWAYSSLLFEFLQRDYIFSSAFFKITLFNKPSQVFGVSLLDSEGQLTVDFPLRVVPAEDTESLVCLQVFFNPEASPSYEVISVTQPEPSRDTKSKSGLFLNKWGQHMLRCVFSSYPSVKDQSPKLALMDHYFTVGFKKASGSVHHFLRKHKNETLPMDEGVWDGEDREEVRHNAGRFGQGSILRVACFLSIMSIFMFFS